MSRITFQKREKEIKRLEAASEGRAPRPEKNSQERGKRAQAETISIPARLEP
jgi:hypothetical protein